MAPPRNATPTRPPSPIGTLARSQAPVDHIHAFSLSRDGPERHSSDRRHAASPSDMASSPTYYAAARDLPHSPASSDLARTVRIRSAKSLSNRCTTDLWTWSTAPAHRVHYTTWCTEPITCAHVSAQSATRSQHWPAMPVLQKSP